MHTLSFIVAVSSGILCSYIYSIYFRKNKSKDDKLYTITRSIKINENVFLEYGIARVQYFRLVDAEHYCIIPSQRLLKTHKTEKSLTILFENHYNILLTRVNHYVQLEIFHNDNLLYGTTIYNNPNIKKIAMHSDDLDEISEFFIKNAV